MPHRRRAGGRGAPPSPLPVVDPSDGIPAHGIIELLSMVLPEGENDEVEFDDGSTSGGNSSDDDGGHRRSPTTTHTVDGRRQRAFETVLASGFTAVLCSSILLGLSEAVTIAELKGFIVAISTCVTVISFTATYMMAGKIRYQSKFRLFQPFHGGIRFVVLQGTAWMFFSVSLLLPLGPLAAAVMYPKSAVVGLSLCGGVAALLGQVAMMCSMPLFGKQDHESPPRGKPVPRRLSRKDRARSLFFANPAWWNAFIAVQVLVSCVSLVLSVLSDAATKDVGPEGINRNDPAYVMGLFAMCCVVLSTMFTYGIGGRWMHSHTQWTFFQPGEGGRHFVLMQAASWIIFSAAVYSFNWRLGLLPVPTTIGLDKVLGPHGLTFTPAAVGGIVAQLLNAMSLSRFEPPAPIPRGVMDPNPIGTQPIARMMWVYMIFNVDKILVSLLLMSWILVPHLPAVIVTTWTVVWISYLPTYQGSPSKTGRRRRPIAGMRWLIDHLAAYFRFEMHRMPECDALKSSDKHIFGFHPHGIVPVTSSWFSLTREWADAFPGIQPALLVSSIIHFAPVLRDMAQFFGSFEVSREGFESALEKRGSVLLVPGGQAEMVFAKSNQRETVIHTSHKGFVRLAMQSAAKSADLKQGKVYLVPIYSFAENELLDNVQIPAALQQWSIKTLRANVLFLPYGTYYAPGFPRRVPATVAVGRPIEVPPVATPSRDQVDALHRLYMHELVEAFDHFKAEANCQDHGIVFDPPLTPLSRSEFGLLWPTLQCRTLNSFRRADVKPQQNTMEIGVVSMFFITNYIGLVLVAIAMYTPCVDEGGWGACH